MSGRSCPRRGRTAVDRQLHRSPEGRAQSFERGCTPVKRFRACIAVSTFLASVAVVSTAAQTPVAHLDAPAAPAFKAIAFDSFVLFNPDSVVPAVEQVFPGRGRELTNLWRTRQFEYAWLRS